MSDPEVTTLRSIDHVQDLLDRLRLDREARDRGAVIVEGPSDASVLQRAVAGELHFFPVGGRVNVLRAADRLDGDYLSGVVCVADLDFDDEALYRAGQWFLVFTDDADLEAMLYWSAALERVLDEWASSVKYGPYGGAAAVRQTVEDVVVILSILRRWSRELGAGLVFDELDLDGLISKQTLKLNIALVVHRLSRPDHVQRKDVQDALESGPPRCPFTGRLRAQGLDRLAVVGAALRNAIGSLSKQQVGNGLVDRSLRLTVLPSDLLGTPFMTRFEAALSAALAA